MPVLIVIYIAFIGLGVPDSLLGTAWPTIYRQLNLPISAANLLTILVSCGTVISSLISARVIHRFGTAKVATVSTFLTAVSLLGFALSGNLWTLCLAAIPLGLGAGSIDIALNNYVSLHYRAIHMNFLHCFYGIGVSISPVLMSFALRYGHQWRHGYIAAMLIQMVIAIIIWTSLPRWPKPTSPVNTTTPVKTLSLAEIAKLKTAWWAWLIFIGSTALEMTCGIWGGTFLVNSRHLSASTAALVVTLYYVGITSGRFIAGIISTHVKSWTIIRVGMVIVIMGIAGVASPWTAAGLFLIGLGNSVVYPNMNYLTPLIFGKTNSAAVMGTQMAASYLGIMIMPPVFGFLAQLFGTWLFPLYLFGLFIMTVVAIGLMNATVTAIHE